MLKEGKIFRPPSFPPPSLKPTKSITLPIGFLEKRHLCISVWIWLIEMLLADTDFPKMNAARQVIEGFS